MWVETVTIITYLKNMSPSNYLKGVTLLEAWSGEKPNVEHFKTFGDIAFVHMPKKL
jgi:hypothetical protein